MQPTPVESGGRAQTVPSFAETVHRGESQSMGHNVPRTRKTALTFERVDQRNHTSKNPLQAGVEMTKMMQAISGLLGRTSLGRQVLDAGRVEEERIAERVAARAKLDASDALEGSLPALESDVIKSEDALEAATERLGLVVVSTRRTYREAIANIEQLRGRALNLLRRTPPDSIAENGPVIGVLTRATEHLRSHLSTEDALLRERVRDHAAAGKPRADRQTAETATALLQRSDWAATCSTAVVEALEAVREAQLEVEPDVPALLATLLDDVVVGRCTCGHQFNFSEAFDVGPHLALTA